MNDTRIEQLNNEIEELETWLKGHPDHAADDRIMVHLEIIRKIMQLNGLTPALSKGEGVEGILISKN